MDHRSALLASIQGREPADIVPVPVAWIRTLLADDANGPDVDLTAAQVAAMFGRSPITISVWCRSGLFPGAYRCRSREWRIPASALAAFQGSEARKAA